MVSSVSWPPRTLLTASLCSPRQEAERRRVSLAGIRVCSRALSHDLESSLAVSFPGLAGKDIRMFSGPPPCQLLATPHPPLPTPSLRLLRAELHRRFANERILLLAAPRCVCVGLTSSLQYLMKGLPRAVLHECALDGNPLRALGIVTLTS